MKLHQATLTHKGITYSADLMVGEDTAPGRRDAECMEVVYEHRAMGRHIVHEKSFPLSNLGTASRDEYTRVMLASVAGKHARITLREI